MTDNYGVPEARLIDSDMSYEEAVLNHVAEDCPKEITNRQVLVSILYYSFDGEVHRGQLILDKRLAKDIEEVFRLILKIKFPIESVIPISHKRFLKHGKWDDKLSMEANNTSAFNYRHIAGTTIFSNHANGFAIDINPKLNPYFKGNIVQPKGATYDTEKPGTLTSNNPVVEKFRELYWEWGGEWLDRKDYQHFEKNLNINR